MSLGDTFFGRAGDDTYLGGIGIDTVDYAAIAAAAIMVNLVSGVAGSSDGGDTAGIGNDVLSDIENIIAGDFADNLSGNDMANQFDGGAGDDSMWGGLGDDTLIGGQGNDMMYGDEGNDLIDGGSGFDRASYNGNKSDFTITKNSSNWTIADTRTGSPEGTDTLTGIEYLSFYDAWWLNLTVQFSPTSYNGSSNTITGTIVDDQIDADALGVANPYKGTQWVNVNLAYQPLYTLGANEFSDIGTVTFTIQELTDLTNSGLELWHATDKVQSSFTVSAADISNQKGGAYTLHWVGNATQTEVPYSALFTYDKEGVYSHNDNIQGNEGDDTIDGGSGNDMASYDGNKSDFTISESNGIWTIADTRAGSPEGTDTLTGIEYLSFYDAWLNLTVQFSPTSYDWSNNTITGTVVDDQIDADALGVATPYKGSEWVTVNLAYQPLYTLGANEFSGIDTVTFTVQELTNLANSGLELWHGTEKVQSSFTVSAADISNQTGGAYTLHWVGTATQTEVPYSAMFFYDKEGVYSHNDNIQGNEGDDSINAGAGNDTVYGNEGDDTIVGGAGNETIDGGDGNDTVVFGGNFAEYSVAYDAASSSYTITDSISGRDGTDMVTSVENFLFADGMKDIIAPTVINLRPADDATRVDLGSGIFIEFSEDIQRGAGAVVIHRVTAAGPVVESMNGNFTISGNILTFNPMGLLSSDTHYFVTFDAGSVKDMAGNDYAGTTTYDFTTPDTIAPALIYFSPLDAATDVPINSNLVLAFSEGIKKGMNYATIVIRRDALNGAIVEGFNVATSENLTIGGNTLTINPTIDFQNGLHYYIIIDAGSVTDLSGNRFAGSTVYDFTTEALVNQAPTFLVGDGKVTTDFSFFSYDQGNGVTVQSDGKILVAGTSGDDFALARYNGDGSLDTSFGAGGKVVTDIGSYSSDQGYSVAVQLDGKIIVAGSSSGDFALVCYNADGSLDTSFGSGGKVVTDIGSASYEQGHSMIIQSDGKIVLAGTSYYNTNGDFALARYNVDGSLDALFGTGGKVLMDFSGYDRGQGVTVQSDGKIIETGFIASYSNDFAIVRYNSDGTLDPLFGLGGKVLTDIGRNSFDYGESVVVQSDGKIIVGGTSDYELVLVRYNVDGNIDISFGTGGKVVTDFIFSDSRSIAMQSDGKIIVAGTSYNDFALARYNNDGSLDASFGMNGKVMTDFGGYAQGYSVTVQSDGKILVTGGSNSDFALARYNTDGSLDKAFDVIDMLNVTPAFIEYGPPVVLDSIAQIYDAELAASGNYAGATLTLLRHGGASAADLFSNIGTLGILSEGSDLMIDGNVIGTVTTNTAGTLAVIFNSSATQALVNSVMQQIAYSNTSHAPQTTVEIDWNFSDSNTGSQGPGGALNTTGSTTVQILPDTQAPTVSITSSASALKIDETATITFSFSENPGSSFTAADITTVGGTLGPLSGDGLTRTALFTPSVGLASGYASITVVDASYTDAAGNAGSAGTTPTISIDTLAPMVSIVSSTSALKIGETAAITFTFSENPGSSFLDADITTTGGTLGPLSGDGLIRSAVFTPMAGLASGSASITVADGSYTDAAGNTGSASATPSISIDTLAPTLSITSSASEVKRGEAAEITFIFSENPGSSFVDADITTTGGTLSALRGNDLIRSAVFTLTPGIASGSASITVADASYKDGAGNTGRAATITINTVATPITISGLALSADTGASATDFITSVAAQTISATLSAPLGSGELLYGSVDNGTTWTNINGKVTGTVISWDGAALSGSSTIQLEVRDAVGIVGTPVHHAYQLDMMAPTVVTITPADHATGVGVSENIQLAFTEDIQKGLGAIELHRDSAAGTLVASYDAATSPNLAISGRTLTINPTDDLADETHYFVTFASGSLRDLAGNNYSGTSTAYDFSTELSLRPLIRNGVSVMPEHYTGPATAAGGAPLQVQFIGDSTNEVLLGTADNDFISAGGGVDAIDGGAGNDVLDGGAGSSFLTGGAGIDIFFIHGSGGEITWSTITDWQAGEQLALWGWTPGTSTIIAWVQDGAEGYKGLTMHADLNGDGTIDTSVTFTGIVSQAQLPTPVASDGLLWFA